MFQRMPKAWAFSVLCINFADERSMRLTGYAMQTVLIVFAGSVILMIWPFKRMA